MTAQTTSIGGVYNSYCARRFWCQVVTPPDKHNLVGREVRKPYSEWCYSEWHFGDVERCSRPGHYVIAWDERTGPVKYCVEINQWGPGPFWDAKALKNPPPTPGLNSSLKNTPQIQKFNLKCKSGDLELKLKFH